MTYARLLELSERELSLALSGAWHDLAALAREREAVFAGLPATVPPDAVPTIERILAVQGTIAAVLTRARAETGAELGRLGHGRGAVRGYASGADTAAA